MTTVSCVRVRSYSSDMFDDLGVPAHVMTPDKATGETVLEFDGELTDEQVQAVCDRLSSRNDDDQLRRAELRDDCAALDEDDPLRRLYCYVLGDQM